MVGVIEPALAARGLWGPAGSPGDLAGYFLVLSPSVGNWGGGKRVKGRLSPEEDTVGVFVKDPPRRGLYEHERCLQYIGGGWFRLHFERPPRDFNSAVVFAEHFLRCCMVGRNDG